MPINCELNAAKVARNTIAQKDTILPVINRKSQSHIMYKLCISKNCVIY